MNQQSDGDESSREPGKKTAQKRGSFVRNLEWGFWANSAWAVIGLLIAGLLITPVFDFMSVPVKVYSITLGICAGFCIVAIFVAHSIVAHREGRTSAQQAAQEQVEKAALKEKIDRLESDLAKVKSEVEDARKRDEPRSLSPEQRTEIIKALSPFPGTKVLVCSVQEFEARMYAQDFIEAFNAAGWECLIGGGTIYSQFLADFENVQISISQEFKDSSVPVTVQALSRTLVRLGIMRGGEGIALHDRTTLIGAQLSDNIVLRVGGKPRRNVGA